MIQKKHLRENWLLILELQSIDITKIDDDILEKLEQWYCQQKISHYEALQYLKKYVQKKERELQAQKSQQFIDERINHIIQTEDFQLDDQVLRKIHHHLFYGLYPDAGEYRHKNLYVCDDLMKQKKRVFTEHSMISKEVQEKMPSSFVLPENMDDKIRTISHMISDLWYIQPFSDGNTRTISVFTQLYLRKLGFQVSNDFFKSNSAYFRTALVRSHYEKKDQQINPNDEGLIKFFENLLLGENHQLHVEDLSPKPLYEKNSPTGRKRI